MSNIELAEALERIDRSRRQRDRVFRDYPYFQNPGWDILLDVTIAEIKGLKLSVSNVCNGVGGAATTALRWIDLLETKGLLFREDDPADPALSYVRPTDEALSLMHRYVTLL